MKRVIVGLALGFACVTALLTVSTEAMANEGTGSARDPSVAALRAQELPAPAKSAGEAGTGVIRGTALDYSGLPPAKAYVMWLTGDNAPCGGDFTDATGSYEITGVPALSGSGQLWLWTEEADTFYKCRGLTFLDPGPTTFDFWPGRLPLTLQRGGPWAGGSWASVELYGSSGVSPVLETNQYLKVGSADAFRGYAYALPGEYTGAVVTFRGGGWPSRRTEAVEIEMPEGAPAVVQAGQTGEVGLVAVERDAARAEVTRWASGAPGSTAVLKLGNLRSGDVYRITGESMNGHEPVRTFATLTVPSPAPHVVYVRLRVPRGVPTGDKYNFVATRVGSHLSLVASYQVCAFKATRHHIAPGQGVKLRGRVPIIPDDRGSNNTMTLTLFKHAGTVGQPRTWQAKGWTKVTTIRTDPYNLWGRFSTPVLRPRRTTSYVIRFPRSFDPSWRGFTSVETVRVD
jgi:hypothetical protein